MRARVTTVKIHPGKLDEFVDVYTNFTVPNAQSQKGFKGAFFLADPETNNTMVISLWESEEDMRAGENSGYYRQQIASREHLFDGTPVREYFDVAAHALNM